MTGQTSSEFTDPLGVAEIVTALQEEIVTSRWAPGTRLPSERKLSDMFSVSRPLIRESLRALNERGIITVSPGRGSFVRDVRASGDRGNAEVLARRGDVTARHIVVARSLLEGEAAALAAENRNENDIADMRRILAGFKAAQVPTVADHDLAFHEAICVASQNPVIQLMFGSIRSLTHGIMLRSLSDRVVARTAVPLHEVIFEAILSKDASAARAAMNEHIGAAALHYGEDLDEPLTEVLHHRAVTSPNIAAVLNRVSESIREELEANGLKTDHYHQTSATEADD